MSKTLRLALWILSSLAVLWTILALLGLSGMGGMMSGRGMMNGMTPDGILPHGGAGMRMAGMMACMALTWAVMLGLDALFVYLVVMAQRSRPAGQQPA